MVPVEDCEICREIPDSITYDPDQDKFPEAIQKLRTIAGTRVEEGHDANETQQCPLCGRHYKYSSSYEWYYSKTDWVISVVRVKDNG